MLHEKANNPLFEANAIVWPMWIPLAMSQMNSRTLMFKIWGPFENHMDVWNQFQSLDCLIHVTFVIAELQLVSNICTECLLNGLQIVWAVRDMRICTEFQLKRLKTAWAVRDTRVHSRLTELIFRLILIMRESHWTDLIQAKFDIYRH